jgi:hypothetical protein
MAEEVNKNSLKSKNILTIVIKICILAKAAKAAKVL